MFKLIWKQQWKQFLYGFVLIAAYVGYIVYDSKHLPTNSGFMSQDVLNIVSAGQAIPALLGMFWGAPLVSSEYESGTVKFIWTQGVSRSQWLFAKLGVTIAMAGIYGFICTVFASWWFNIQLSGLPIADRFDAAQFGLTGFMPIVYAIFAVAVGAAIGTWIRKSVPTIAATLVVYVAFQWLFISYIRPHYMPLMQYAYKPSRGCVTTVSKNAASVTCAYTDFGPKDLRSATSWVLGYKQMGNGVVIYQPAYRYWDFQEIEASLFLGLSAVAILATYQMATKKNV